MLGYLLARAGVNVIVIEKHADVVGQCVEENIYERHLKRLFNL